MKTFKPLTKDEVIFELSIEEEDIPIRGSFDSGDAEQDLEIEREITKKLERGDLWAWCCVKVTATWRDWREEEYLGACSYEDEADFKADRYYESMCDEALARLNETLAKTFETLAARAS